MKMISRLVVAIAMIATLIVVNAKDIPTTPVPVGEKGGGGAPSCALPFDPMAFVNRAALASLAIQHVDHYMVSIFNGGSANFGNGADEYLYEYSSPVKSLQEIMNRIMNTTYVFKVVDPSQPTYVTVTLYKGNPFRGWDENGPTSQILLSGSFSGPLSPAKGGGYYLNGHVRIALNSHLIVVFPDVVVAKAIHTYAGDSWAESLRTYGGGSFRLPVSLVANGILVIGRSTGEQWFHEAFSLVTGEDVPVDDAIITIVIGLSPEFFIFKNPATIDLTIDSYKGYGINSLIIVTIAPVPCPEGYTCSTPTSISLRLRTTEGIVAHSFLVKNLTTGESKTLAVPAGSAGINLQELSVGEYHIIPQINLLSAPFNGGWDGGGKAGGDTGAPSWDK